MLGLIYSRALTQTPSLLVSLCNLLVLFVMKKIICVILEYESMNKYESMTHTYLENVFIGGAAVCVVGNISDDPVLLHSDCPHRHHHLFSSQNSCIQDVGVLQRRKSLIHMMFDNTLALLTSASSGQISRIPASCLMNAGMGSSTPAIQNPPEEQVVSWRWMN